MHRLRYVFVAGLLALPAYAGAQVKDATDVLASEIEALAANLAKGGDMQGRLVDFGKINVGIGVVRWPAGARGVLAHSQVGEVYYMVEGTGTLDNARCQADGRHGRRREDPRWSEHQQREGGGRHVQEDRAWRRHHHSARCATPVADR